MSDQLRFQKIVEDRMKSSNERELERYEEEEREKIIKEHLEYARKKREHDINFNHNPINTKNITNGTSWEVLKEKNQFSNVPNVCVGHKSVLRGNKKLLRSSKKMLKGGKLFKI